MTRVYISEHAHRATWRFFCELVLSSTNFFVSSVSSVHCELFPMETSSASTLRKVCPQYSTTAHVRRAVCGCGYAFPSKRRARPDSVSQAILAEGLHFRSLVIIFLNCLPGANATGHFEFFHRAVGSAV